MEDLDVLDKKFLSHCLEMLQFNIDFVLKNADFSQYSSDMCASLRRVKHYILLARSQYVNEIKFDHVF